MIHGLCVYHKMRGVKEVEENSSLFYNICVVDTQKSQGNENQRQKKKLNLFSNFFYVNGRR